MLLSHLLQVVGSLGLVLSAGHPRRSVEQMTGASAYLTFVMEAATVEMDQTRTQRSVL